MKSIPGERLLLVDDPEEHDQQAAQEGHEGPIEALGGDQGVGDDEACRRRAGRPRQDAGWGRERPVGWIRVWSGRARGTSGECG